MGLGKFVSKIAPILPVVGDVIGGVMANSAQKRANRANVALQREQQLWEENMSNTAWQRGTKDMIAAGLNPMLAYSQGGASTPNVSAATVEPVDALARSVSSAAGKAAAAAQLKLTLDRMSIDNDIQKQKRLQEEITTDIMQEKYSAGGYTQEEVEQMRQKTAQATNEARLKEIEKEIAEQTKDVNISTAKARLDLTTKEITFKEMQTVLAGLDIPEKEAMAKWFTTVGAASPAAKAVMSISQWLRFILRK